MAASYGSGGTSPPVIGRPLERVFEEAQFTGEVNLSGRTLKEYPKFSNKYDLVDTIAADLSKNRFNEVPQEVCEYTSMEKLNLYHNVIRSIPEAITQLQQLTHLNLSRNQLTVLPPTLCQLQSLEVLVASNNRLVSLPEEVGRLEKLMDLDVSCNEISHLPMQIGDLSSLRCLNVRRNHLVELPVEISKLHLRKMDISSNRIERIPTVFRKIDSLEEFILDHNPLMMPPAHVCTKGRQHIMKYLQMDEKKRGVLNDMDIKRLSRKSLPPQQTTDEFRNLLDSPESKWKRHTVLSSDSGYSTTDSLEKVGWAPSEVPNDMDEANSLAIKAAEAVKEQRHGRELDLQRRYGQESRSVSGPPEMASVPPPQISVQQASLTPPQNSSSTPPLSSTDLEDEFTRELQRQKAEYERKKKQAEQLRLQREEEECQERRRAAHRLQEEQQRLLIERQKHEVMARQEEERLREEAMRLAEEARIAEEARLAEEAARLAEEQRLQEEARRMEEARQREEQKPPTDQRKPRQDNKRQIPRRQTANSLANSRKSQSMKEDRKTPNSTQYRRTASDTLKKAHGTHGSNAHVDNLNYINRNGVPDDETMSNNSTTPGASPIPSPVSTPMALSPRTISPATSNPSLSRLQSSDRPSPSQSPATRRARVGERTTGVASPSNLRPATRVPGSTTTSRSAAAPSTAKKNHPTPEEEFRLKHQALKNQQHTESVNLRRRLEEKSRSGTQGVAVKRSGAGDADRRTASSTAKTNAYNAASRATRPGKKAGKDGGTGNLSAASVKMLEEYKDADPNLTIRRQYEHQREENQQLEMLRQTIESRLKVTLPDNLTDALKDGVVLCHLANQIRPRSVVSVHVPSPAVPKLNMAKCRRNVENFLDACRKIGVDQDHLCACDDIVEALRPTRVAKTVQQLVRFRRLTPKDYYVTYFCICLFTLAVVMALFFPRWLEST